MRRRRDTSSENIIKKSMFRQGKVPEQFECSLKFYVRALARCIFRRNALHAGGPLPSLTHTLLGLWVFCGSGVRSFAAQGGGGMGSGIQSLK